MRKEDYSIYDLGQHNLHYNANVKRSRPLEDYSIEYARWFLVYQFKILNSIQNKQGNTITLDQNTKDFFEAVSRFKNLLGTNYNFFPPHIEKELEKAIKVTNK